MADKNKQVLEKIYNHIVSVLYYCKDCKQLR